MKYLYAIMLIFCASAVNAEVVVDRQLDIRNGLSHNGAISMMVDSHGYLWIGTFDGLNRYNYFDFAVCKNRVGAEPFQSNRIYSVAEDRKGQLWVGTDFGVTIFDYDKYSFRQLAGVEGGRTPAITKIFVDDEAVVAIGDERVILVYGVDGELLRADALPDGVKVYDALSIGDGRYLLAASNMLMLYNQCDGSLEKINLGVTQQVTAIVEYDKDNYVVGLGSGVLLAKIDTSGGCCKVLDVSNIWLSGVDVNVLAIDGDDRLWVGSEDEGLFYVADYRNQSTVRTVIPELRESRISDLLFKDDQIYVSTFGRGVAVLRSDVADSPFTIFEDSRIVFPEVVKYDEDRVLINSAHDLILYNISTQQEEPLPFFVPKPVKQRFKAVTKDAEGRVWIVSNNEDGVLVIHKVENSKVVNVSNDKVLWIKNNKKIGPGSAPVQAEFDGDGNLWIAYINKIYRLSFDQSGEISNVESLWSNKTVADIGDISRPRSIYYDKQCNVMWIGTSRVGLFRIELGETLQPLKDLNVSNYIHKLDDPRSISADFVSSIIRTSQGVLWIGTEQGGFCRAKENDADLSFETISEDDGLSNNVVKSICEDSKANLWVATNIGLNLYNPQSGTFVSYHNNNDVGSDDFWYSSYGCDDGELVFVQPRQILTFDSKSLYKDGLGVKIDFDKLRVNNRVVHPNANYNGEVILTKQLSDGDRLELSYDQNFFSIDIATLYEHSYFNHDIRYQLLPVNKNWIDLPTSNRSIAFNGIEPGEYRLRVGESDVNGDMLNVVELQLVITPPLWESTFAYLCYFVAIILIIVIVVGVVFYMQSLNYRLEVEMLEKGVNEDKLRYLSNISHELKTPLSLILAPVALLRERFMLDVDVASKLDLIKRQSKKMLELIDLTHSVEANDLKGLRLSKTKFLFDGVVDDLSTDFEFMTQYDSKKFVVEKCSSAVGVDADRAMLEKIINNLVTNALKHTSQGDEIVLNYEVVGNSLIIKVSDSGLGIHPDDLPYIFDRFYKARRSGNNNMGGTGIGLTFTKMLVELHGGKIWAESALNVGSTFTVELPIVVDRDEIVELPCKNQVVDGMVIVDDDYSEIVVEGEYSSSLIYLVEDNGELRQVLCDIIGRRFNVRCYGDGEELLRELENEWPDLIVSDVMMPNISGLELCQRVKNDIKTSHIPIILLTACSTVDDKIKGFQVGADAYIPKPFYPKHLVTRIEMLLHSRQLLRDRFKVGVPLVCGKEGNNSAKDNEFMCRLYELFNNNLDNEEINMDHIARELGQNRSLFFKKVKVITNSTPNELLKEYRLTRASELLRSGDYNVSEVCAMTGFKDRSHFSRLFKAKFDVSPSKYVAEK